MFFRKDPQPDFKCYSLIKNKNQINIYHNNIRSARFKIDQLFASWAEPPDILCLTEHWLTENEPIIIPNFTCISKFCRRFESGGGVMIYANLSTLNNRIIIKPRLDLMEKYCNEYVFECNIVSVEGRGNKGKIYEMFTLVCIYRAPKNNIREFMVKFEDLLHTIIKGNNSKILICGDWNLNFLDTELINVKYLRNIFECFNLKEYIKKPTRITNNSETLLDNVVSNIESDILICHSVFNGLSDHDAQLMFLTCDLSSPDYYKTKRLFSNSNVEQFSNQLSTFDWSILYNNQDINVNFDLFVQTVSNTFNVVFKHKKIKQSSNQTKKMILSWELKKIANSNVDLGILARDTKDPILKALFKKRQKLFCKLLISEKRPKYLSN